MKKILLMTMGTALLSAGAIAEGVSISGSADMGVKYGDSKATWLSNFDVGFSASGTTDGGLTFGAAAKIKAADGNEKNKSAVGSSNVYVSGEAWKVSIGDLDPASHMARPLGDVGYDGLGVDDVAEGNVGSTQADALAKFTLGTASLGITTGVKGKKNEWAVGLSVDAGNMSFGVGADSQKLAAISAKASMGGISTVLYYAKDQYDSIPDGEIDILGTGKASGLGVSASFVASDNTTVSIVWAKGKDDFAATLENDEPLTEGAKKAIKKNNMDTDGIGIGISTDLGGGAKLQAGIAKVNDKSKVSAGISMSF